MILHFFYCPFSMRGVKSEGMVMCVTDSASGKIRPLDVPSDSKEGDRVFFEGLPSGSPDEVLNPKKKVWETLKPGLRTNDKGIAEIKTADGLMSGKMRTERGEIKSDFAFNSQIS